MLLFGKPSLSGIHIFDGLKPRARPSLIISYFVRIRQLSYCFGISPQLKPILFLNEMREISWISPFGLLRGPMPIFPCSTRVTLRSPKSTNRNATMSWQQSYDVAIQWLSMIVPEHSEPRLVPTWSSVWRKRRIINDNSKSEMFSLHACFERP